MRGLLMIEPLYHKTVKGAKTMTRRAGSRLNAINDNPDEWEETGTSMVHTKYGIGLESVDFCNYKRTQENVVCEPLYRVGEVLYLKEPLIIMGAEPVYKFDLSEDDGGRQFIKWQNKLFMPAKYARAFVRITVIKCERLLDISDEDCIAEGIETAEAIGGINDKMYRYYLAPRDWCLTPKESFISLYKFANKVKEVPNLWVWVYSIEYLKDYKPA